MPAVPLAALAALVNGTVIGDEERRIEGVRSLDAAGPQHLSFLTDPRWRSAAARTRAGALLVGQPDETLPCDLLVCAEPAAAVARLLAFFHPEPRPEAGIHTTAVVGAGCDIAATAHLGPQVVVGPETRIGERCQLHSGVVVGPRCQIGDDTVLHPRVVIYANTELGRRVIVHAGAVLGSDGFRYVAESGRMIKVPQVGRLVVEDDVEIGANTTVDRGALEETRIGQGSKLDNLVQVGHNVRLEAGCVICGQAGIAGSVHLGPGVVLGGRAGVVDHLEVGAGSQVAGASVVMTSLPANSKVGGTPAVPLIQWRRQRAWARRLGELFKRVRKLEQNVGTEQHRE